jgi:hypothetical protein
MLEIRLSIWRAAERSSHGTMGAPGNRRKIYRLIEELQINLNDWLHRYNHDRTHQDKKCCGQGPLRTLIDAKEDWNDKITALSS